MGEAVCDRNCFQCPFPDCVVDEMSYDERKAYREANREKVAARQKAYREANRE